MLNAHLVSGALWLIVVGGSHSLVSKSRWSLSLLVVDLRAAVGYPLGYTILPPVLLEEGLHARMGILVHMLNTRFFQPCGSATEFTLYSAVVSLFCVDRRVTTIHELVVSYQSPPGK